MNVPGGKIQKRVNDLDPTVFNEQGQFSEVCTKGGQRHVEGRAGPTQCSLCRPGRGFPAQVRKQEWPKDTKKNSGFWP